MSDVLVKRWKRYGHDRVYVETADGFRLGHWDNKTNTACLEDASQADVFYTALREQLNIVPPASDGAEQVTTAPDAAPSPQPPRPPSHGDATADPQRQIATTPADGASSCDAAGATWRDLAQTRAGAGVRAQARQARQAAPVRTLLARVLGVHTDERAWRLGADGEEAVAAQLRKLDGRWRTIHSVPVGSRDSDIDHVVIGPGGVYTVNAKNHPNACVSVGGNAVR